ncbi:transferrin-binding protein-like solute binding protein [Novosphingobium sp. G106]|uniref:transferrin-binding protein-like solute binding protein n=1 Tax=Novosphingobium sp. G106 TaxID=2849500 RepID=UPI001C2D87EC|nr:transferrin-binding protein-like solute binding protein [Novosphingobium sp. G106]MBV1691745.1 transferrin-binding protein-like solute binding protein [Novosphingobium sp. G106]
MIGLMLTGCGSGESGSVVSTPTPTPASYTKLSDMSGDRTLQTAGVQYSQTVATGVTNSTSQPLGSGFSLAYTASSDSYKLTASDGTSVTFLPLDRQPTSPSMPNVQHWAQRTLACLDNFFLTAPTVGGVALSYTVIANWQHSPDLAVADVRLAVGGVPTLASDMPRTGSATYVAALDGFAQGGSYLLGDGSTAAFSADFAHNSVSTAMTLAGTPVLPGGSITPFGTFNGTGTISSTSPGFTGTLNGNGATGLFSGAFFGPKAGGDGLCLVPQRRQFQWRGNRGRAQAVRRTQGSSKCNKTTTELSDPN